jgi:hypothetical protein
MPHWEDRMADEQLDRLESFRVFIKATEEGASIPPVDRDDLRYLHELHSQITKQYPGKDGVVPVDLMASVCSPGANLPAVWLRHTRLRSLERQGVLAEWRHSTELDDAVYQVAATIPMQGFQLDQEAFVERLRYGAAA